MVGRRRAGAAVGAEGLMTQYQKRIAAEVLERMKGLTDDQVSDYAAIWFNIYVLRLSGKLKWMIRAE